MLFNVMSYIVRSLSVSFFIIIYVYMHGLTANNFTFTLLVNQGLVKRGIVISAAATGIDITSPDTIVYAASDFKTELLAVMDVYPTSATRYFQVKRTDNFGGHLSISEIKIIALP